MDVVLASARSDLILALEVFLREQPGMIVIGTATGTRGLLALVETICPDLVILDWALPGQLPAKALAAVRKAKDPLRILVLGRDEGERLVALAAGADEFVRRGDPPETLITALRQLCARHGPVDESSVTQSKGE